MTTVYVDSFESFDAAFRRFNKKVQESRILIEVKERQAYKKPSDARRAEKAAARSRAAKRKRKMDRVLEFQSMHKFPLRKRHNPNNNRPHHSNNNQPNTNNPRHSQNSQHHQARFSSENNKQKTTSSQPSNESLKSLQDKFNTNK